MMKADNDNDEFSFITLSAATRNVTRYLGMDKKQDEQREGKDERDRRDEEKRKAHSDYVAKRVSDIAAFERRVAGKN